jgi:hypothetical protein
VTEAPLLKTEMIGIGLNSGRVASKLSTNALGVEEIKGAVQLDRFMAA